MCGRCPRPTYCICLRAQGRTAASTAMAPPPARTVTAEVLAACTLALTHLVRSAVYNALFLDNTAALLELLRHSDASVREHAVTFFHNLGACRRASI